MKRNVINFISRLDDESYEIIVEALKLYDDYLHSLDSLSEVIKVRKIINDLTKARKRRFDEQREEDLGRSRNSAK